VKLLPGSGPQMQLLPVLCPRFGALALWNSILLLKIILLSLGFNVSLDQGSWGCGGGLSITPPHFCAALSGSMAHTGDVVTYPDVVFCSCAASLITFCFGE